MNYLNALLDAIVGFVKRNPILVTVIVLLAIGAPSLLQGIATFILYMVLFFLVLIVGLALMLRWRIYKVQREVKEQMRNGQGGNQGFNPFGGFGGFGGGQSAPQQEGEVKIRRTELTPEKRISDEVGDYVDFEETKDN